MDKFSVLQQYFGHSSFRPGQEQVVDAIVSGQDVLGVMPTGAGKSVCYQVPAMLMPGLTLVISPLISLMQDQVAALEEEGVHAACLNSALPEGLYSTILRAALEGDYKILYVAPERLLTDSFLYLAMHARIAFVAVDEAHCVSQWGQDFRPSYLKIAEFISRLPYRPVIGAFTATATEQVKQDIIALLQLNQPFTLTTGFDRPNLYFGVARPRDKERYIEEYILDHRDRSGIVYCATRKSVESVCKELRSVGISATRYHAGLTPEERSKNQEDFVYDRKRVMVATNAFGMGIDKSNVSFVLHYNMPKNLENYYQEAGRAGRDGERAECILLFSLGDVQTAKYFIQNSHDNDELTPEQAEAAARRDRERLDVMVGYCKTTRCLRSYLLDYFGEHHTGGCGNCSNCLMAEEAARQMEQRAAEAKQRAAASARRLAEKPRRRPADVELSAEDEKLLADLYALRKRLASKQKIPAYLVFSDATLREMVQKKPFSTDELLNITGVGEKKAARYGTIFLAAIEEAVRSR